MIHVDSTKFHETQEVLNVAEKLVDAARDGSTQFEKECLRITNKPRQQNNHNCGIFVLCKVIENYEFLRSEKPATLSDHKELLRKGRTHSQARKSRMNLHTLIQNEIDDRKKEAEEATQAAEAEEVE